MPLGKYKTFADCVKANQGKDDPEAYCGSIEHATNKGLTLTRSQVEVLCPDCGTQMAKHGIRSLKLNALDQLPVKLRKALAAALGGDTEPTEPVERIGIVKTDPDKGLVFGWSTIAEKNGEAVVDLQGDMIEPAELEDAVYDFMLHSRESGEMHVGTTKGHIVESVVFTPEKLEKMGFVDHDFVGHWIGVKLDDPAVFARVRSGELTAFSIQGSAQKMAA